MADERLDRDVPNTGDKDFMFGTVGIGLISIIAIVLAIVS